MRRARWIVVAVAVALLSVIGIGVSPTAAQTTPVTAPVSAPVTTAPLATTGQGAGKPQSIPSPNSGVAPQASGDRGGWAQLALMLLTFVGMAAIVGRVAWAASKRTKAKAGTA